MASTRTIAAATEIVVKMEYSCTHVLRKADLLEWPS